MITKKEWNDFINSKEYFKRIQKNRSVGDDEIYEWWKEQIDTMLETILDFTECPYERGKLKQYIMQNQKCTCNRKKGFEHADWCGEYIDKETGEPIVRTGGILNPNKHFHGK